MRRTFFNEFNINRENAWVMIHSSVSTDRKLYESLARLMRRHGFSWRQDPHVKKHWPVLSNDHHYGQLGGLEFHTNICPASIQLNFFQSINFENPNGGRYDFYRFRKMPYLIKLRFLKIIGKIKDFLLKKGLVDCSDPEHKTGLGFIRWQQSKTAETHRNIYEEQVQRNCTYNICDQDNVVMKNGDVRYFYHYKGHLMRGTVYYALNNMWWVDLGGPAWTKMANWQFFSWKPDLPRRNQDNSIRVKRLRQLLDKSVKEMRFEKSVILRDLIQNLEKPLAVA